MNARVTAIEPLKIDLADFMGKVEHGLDLALKDEPRDQDAKGDTLMSTARHLSLGCSGKRVRPMLVRLFGEACGAPVESLVDVAIAAELIYLAGLLHDEVVDAGMSRPGEPTVNAQWSNIVAVMSGDILLSLALGRLTRMDPRITETAVTTITEMTRAAIAELEARGDPTISLERFRAISGGKTGALFGWCGTAAALLAGDMEATTRFTAFGQRLGLAFQIADEVRDLTGADEGKPRYARVQSRKPSLPILLAVSKDETLRRRLMDAWAYSAMIPDRANELGSAILASGVIEPSLKEMRAEITAGINSLGHYASAPGGPELVAWAHRLADGILTRA